MLCSVWALREFLSYIYGQRFLLRTDRSFLRWMTTFKEPEGQVARWLARVRSQFYWPWMSGDVHTWCRTCTQCTKRKAPTKNNVAPMQAMAARYPLQRVGIDILGPLEKSPSENRCVQVLMDYFNKWSAAFSLAKWKPVPWPICWSRITSRTLAPMTTCLATKAAHLKRLRCWRCASCSALRRRDPSHTTHKGMYPGQYDDMLPFDMLANNRSDYESPGVTPAIAMLDRAPSLALSPRATGLHPRDPRAYRPCARAGEGPPEDAATSPNCLHDQHAKELRFSLNDRMWLAMPRRGKLDREWEGPYQVVEVMGPQTYRVRHHERNRSTLVVHSYQIQRYHAKDTIELPDEGEPSVRDGTTRRKKHQPPGAASPPSSEMRESTGRTSLKEGSSVTATAKLYLRFAFTFFMSRGADTDRANEIFPAENEDEDTEATVARSVFVFVSSSTLVSDCLIKYISIVCCFVVAMPSGKRETERKVNAPVNTGPSPNSDERVNNPTEGANEPARESGSLQGRHSIDGSSYCPCCSFLNGALSYPVPQPKGACAPVSRRQFTTLRQ
ncbi:hypothetical protein T02_10321 [Trichinella nativa]|uniref:RNA-directed DNA polymerase n=1 Tax=Trichinella nativa TaxID=6335 RepID=A0A0V1KRT5_9BILA|nr:hypothetical protein T02_10321 [Trichinella nativa]